MDRKILDAFRKRAPGQLPPIAAIPVLHVWNVTSRVEAPREMLFDLDERLKATPPDVAYRIKDNYDGCWHPLNRLTGRFPTGLLRHIRNLLPTAKVIDYRQRPPTREIDPYLLLTDPDKPEEPFVTIQGEKRLVPREDQVAGLLAVLDVGRCVLNLSVGIGKTETGLLIALHVPGKCVIIVHRKDLLHQTAERIRIRTGQEPALIGDGLWDDRAGETVKFVVAMDQTVGKPEIERTADGVKKHYELLKLFAQQVADAQTVILDECHRTTGASSWYMVAQHIPNAYFRVGLTGSADTGDPVKNLRLEAATGHIAHEIKAAEAARKGILVPAKVIYHKAPVPAGPLPQWDYRDARRGLIEENAPRNSLIVDLALQEAQAGRRCLVICDTVRHVRRVADILRGTGIRAVVLTGRQSSGARGAAKKDLQSGVLEVALCSPIWDEGVDLPQLESVILAAGGKSAVRMLQRVGRALRKAPGKTMAVIHDFWDSAQGHLLEHSMARLNLCRKEGFQVVLPPTVKIP